MARSATSPRSIRIVAQGRLVIPSDLRKAFRVQPGDALVAWVEDDQLVLRPRRVVEEELWTLFNDVEESLATEPIHERREEARREQG